MATAITGNLASITRTADAKAAAAQAAVTPPAPQPAPAPVVRERPIQYPRAAD